MTDATTHLHNAHERLLRLRKGFVDIAPTLTTKTDLIIEDVAAALAVVKEETKP